jgi:hypothetical protein
VVKSTADGHSSCVGKESFDSPAAAAKVLKRLAGRKNAHPHKGLDPYRCDYCHRWHLGRPVTQSKQELRREHARFVKRGSLRYAESHPSR